MKDASPQVFIGAKINQMNAAGVAGLLGPEPLAITVSYIAVLTHIMSAYTVAHGLEYDRQLMEKMSQMPAANGSLELFKKLDTETFDATDRFIQFENKQALLNKQKTDHQSEPKKQKSKGGDPASSKSPPKFPPKPKGPAPTKGVPPKNPAPASTEDL